MAGPEGTQEDPHKISFSHDLLGVSSEINLTDLAMESLNVEERGLLESLVKAQVYSLAVLMKVIGRMTPTEWRRELIRQIEDQRETISNAEGYLPRFAELLRLNIEPPPNTPEIRDITSSQAS